MKASEVTRVVKEFNRSIAAREYDQWLEMGRRWHQMESRLEVLIKQLSDEIHERDVAGLPNTLGSVKRLERYRELVNQVAWEGSNYERYAADLIAREQMAYSEIGLSQAQEVLRQAVTGNWNRLNISAVQNMTGLAGDGSPLFAVLKKRALSPEMVGGLTDKLIEAVGLGYNPRKTARMMRDGLTQGLTKALTIARTEQIRAYRQASMDQYAAAGVKQYERHCALSERTCEACLALDGKLQDTDELFASHPNCILPGNEVVSPGIIRAATKAFYTGRCVEVSFEDGRIIAVTQNHPILTWHGWVAAQFLSEGDYVISTSDTQGILDTIHPDNNNRPAMIEQIFDTLKVSNNMSTISMPTTSKDFYGDGGNINGEVEIINVNGFLWCDIRESRFKHIKKIDFRGRDTSWIDFARQSMFDFGINSLCHAIDGDMCRQDLFGSLLRSHLSPFQGLRFGLGPESNTTFQEQSSSSGSADTDLTGEFIFRYAGFITRNKIVKIRNFNFSGHVFDLQVEPYNLIICNTIITHNCRCFVTPVIDGETTGGESGADWLAKQDEELQRSILGAHYDAYQMGVPLTDMVGVRDDPIWGPTTYIKPSSDIYTEDYYHNLINRAIK